MRIENTTSNHLPNTRNPDPEMLTLALTWITGLALSQGKGEKTPSPRCIGSTQAKLRITKSNQPEPNRVRPNPCPATLLGIQLLMFESVSLILSRPSCLSHSAMYLGRNEISQFSLVLSASLDLIKVHAPTLYYEN